MEGGRRRGGGRGGGRGRGRWRGGGWGRATGTSFEGGESGVDVDGFGRLGEEVGGRLGFVGAYGEGEVIHL